MQRVQGLGQGWGAGLAAATEGRLGCGPDSPLLGLRCAGERWSLEAAGMASQQEPTLCGSAAGRRCGGLCLHSQLGCDPDGL